jgi:two-component system phosphate regulon sensor histidine kinase PhoR
MMKNNYIKLITCLALVSILFLQGIWLYNTYSLLETEFKKNFDKSFLSAVEKGGYNQLTNPERKKSLERKIVEGFYPDNDPFTNIMALQDFLYKEGYPITLEEVDSIFNKLIAENFEYLDYTLYITDSMDNKIASVNHRKEEFRDNSFYTQKIQLRTSDPEFIIATVSSPYKLIFGKMLLLLTGSVVLTVIVGYCLFLQIKIIVRQDRIAEIRQDFTHAMIHDMKNPITAILMGINTLKGGKIDDKPRMKDQYYTVITREGEHLLTLTNKILTIAQMEEEKITLSKQLIPLPDLLHDLTEKYRLNTLKEIQFRIELNGVENIYADYDYIYEAFSNIIDNAVKYSKEKVNISITALVKRNYVQIKFRDDGIGISRKDQEKIFEKFERAASVRRSGKISGFGLGLSYVYQVVKAHGGKIELKSELGAYSEFTINLLYNDKITID